MDQEANYSSRKDWGGGGGGGLIVLFETAVVRLFGLTKKHFRQIYNYTNFQKVSNKL